MRVHVVYGHPVPDSFAATLHRAVLDGLARAGHEVDDLDLYAEGFSPALSEAERRGYEDSPANEAPVAAYVARLRAAEALVFCFPTWWYAMPAMVKGYLDRVLLPGVAFHLPPGGGAIRPGLTHLRKLGVVTTTGSPWWLVRLVMREPNRAVFMRGLRRLLAPRAPGLYLSLYDLDRATAAVRQRFLERVRRAFAAF